MVDVRGIVEVTMLLPGKHAAQVRRQAAELRCRYLGGDISLVDEVCALRGFQEELAVRAPEDPALHSAKLSSQLRRLLPNTSHVYALISSAERSHS